MTIAIVLIALFVILFILFGPKSQSRTYQSQKVRAQGTPYYRNGYKR